MRLWEVEDSLPSDDQHGYDESSDGGRRRTASSPQGGLQKERNAALAGGRLASRPRSRFVQPTGSMASGDDTSPEDRSSSDKVPTPAAATETAASTTGSSRTGSSGQSSRNRHHVHAMRAPPVLDTYADAMEADPRLVLPLADEDTARRLLHEPVDAFEAIDDDGRIVPSLVWSPSQMRGAILSDGPIFDCIVLTDVGDVDVAVGLLVLISAFMPPTLESSLQAMQAATPVAEAAEGHASTPQAHQHQPQGAQAPSLDSNAPARGHGPGGMRGPKGSKEPSHVSSDSPGISRGVDGWPNGSSLAVPLSVLLPRIVIMFEAGLPQRQQDRIRYHVNRLCPGVSCVPMETTGFELYGKLVLPSFARAARWQELACQHAMGADYLRPQFSMHGAERASWEHMRKLASSARLAAGAKTAPRGANRLLEGGGQSDKEAAKAGPTRGQPAR